MIDLKRSWALLTLVVAALLLGGCPEDSSSSTEALGEPEPSAVGPLPDVSHPVSLAASYGVQLLQPPMFDCKPVKNDEGDSADQTPVPTPPFTPGMFPCTRCHDKPDDFNMTPRTLTLQHTDIKLNHGPHEQWCYGCHNPSDRDKLRLAGGRLISFDQSYELCGQCHGEKLRDWRLGIHGRRTGCWNGKREYLLCVNCHNQHSPKFAPRRPLPRPKMPGEIQEGGE